MDLGCSTSIMRSCYVVLLLGFFQSCFMSVPAQGQAPSVGQWQTLTNTMPINPIHIALMNNGKVLVVSGDGYNFNSETFQAGVFDPATGTTTTQTTNSDMFCNGMVVLQDGRPFVVGGTLT